MPICTPERIQWRMQIPAFHAPMSDPSVRLQEIRSNIQASRCPRDHEQNIIVISAEQAIRRDAHCSVIRKRRPTAGELDLLYYRIHATAAVKNSLAMIFDTGMREKFISTSVAPLAVSDHLRSQPPKPQMVRGLCPRSQSKRFAVPRARLVLRPCRHMEPALSA